MIRGPMGFDFKRFRAKEDIKKSIKSIEDLLATRIVETPPYNAVSWAVVSRLSVLVRDLVEKSDALAGKRVDFTDDVIVRGRVRDAASLITFMRDALCHIESDNHLLSPTTELTLIAAFGKAKPNRSHPSGADIPPADYDDDIAFIFGVQRIYFRRHLLRAFRESVANLSDFLKK